MTADIIAIPVERYRKAAPRKRLTDMRQVPLAYQPQALTLPGERWQINAYDMTQVIVIRDGPEPHGQIADPDRHQRIVGRFVTARDAMAAAQSRAIAEDVIRACEAAGTDDAEIGRKVREILQEYGR